MPKKACSDLQGIRFELQQSERDTLEAYLAANGVGQVLQGVGAVLAPFSAAFAVFVAAYLADEIVGQAKTVLDGVVDRNRETLAQPANDSYMAITAYLTPLSWPLDLEAAKTFKKSPDGQKTAIPQRFMRRRFQQFITMIGGATPMFRVHVIEAGMTPAESWALFYPYEEMQNDAIYEVNQSVGRLGPFFRWIVPEPTNQT